MWGVTPHLTLNCGSNAPVYFYPRTFQISFFKNPYFKFSFWIERSLFLADLFTGVFATLIYFKALFSLF